MSIGHSIDGAKSAWEAAKGVNVDDLLRLLSGKDFANAAQLKGLNAMGGLGAGTAGPIARFAGSKAANNILRLVPGLTTGLVALDAADIVTNDTNIGNKAMDAAAMGIGGVLGSVGGPLGAMAGASTGKFASDSLQWLFGDKKTPEQRKLEEAIALIGGRG